MWILVLALIGAGAFVMSQNKSGSSNLLLGLPDIDPDEQKGPYKRDFDDYFLSAGHRYDVPFALMKAHAIRESSLKPGAFLADRRGGSYGLMQLSWGVGNERFSVYGYSATRIGNGELLYDNGVNTEIAAQLIADNLKRFGNVRDAINAYNTGVAYTDRVAPHNYTEDVLKYYETIIGRTL